MAVVRRQSLVLGLAAASAVSSAGAQGERPTATFSYERARGAERCPESSEVEEAVAARLGYVPFRPGAELHVVARIESDPRGLLATVEVLDAEGRSVGGRTIRSRTRDCEELSRALALAVSVAIDPMSLLSPETDGAPPALTPPEGVPAAEAESPLEPNFATPVPELIEAPVTGPGVAVPTGATPTEAAPAEVAATPADDASDDARFTIRAEGGALLAYDATPGLRPGGVAGVGARRGHLALGGELRFVGRGRASNGVGGVEAYRFDVRARACGHLSSFVVCGTYLVGVVRGRGLDVANARTGIGFVTGPGMLVGFEHAIGSRAGFLILVGADAPILRPRLELSAVEVFRGSPVSPYATLAAFAEFP